MFRGSEKSIFYSESHLRQPPEILVRIESQSQDYPHNKNCFNRYEGGFLIELLLGDDTRGYFMQMSLLWAL